MQIPYPLISAVHDLYTLYTRHGPVGPYRHTLFHDQPLPEQDWPEAVRSASPVLDVLLRGVTCLLANDLGLAAPPLCQRLLAGVLALERKLRGPAWIPAAYYAYLRQDLQHQAAGDPIAVYRLFGEVLAVYLDVLLQARATTDPQLQRQVSQLRQAVLQFADGGAEGGAGSTAG